MSTERTHNKVKALWDIVSSSGLAASPQVAVEQIACLIMIKYVESIGHATSWSLLLKGQATGLLLIKRAFRSLREAENLLGFNGLFADAYFQLEVAKPEALAKLLKAVNRTFVFDERLFFQGSTNGAAFDYLLRIASVGGNSLDPTPRRISRFMVALLDPKPGQSVIDPAAGTGRLMVYAHRYQGSANAKLRKEPVGIEVDKSLGRIAWVNLLLNHVKTTKMHYGNSVSEIQDNEVSFGNALKGGQYDFVFSELPTGNIDENAYPENAGYLPVAAFGASDKVTRRLELLFIWRAIDLLKIKGRAALIVSESVLYGNTRGQRKLRRELLTQHLVEGVILMPKSSASVAILLFAKAKAPSTSEPRTSNVWFYDISRDWGLNGYGDFYDALVHFRQQALLDSPYPDRGACYETLVPADDIGARYPADTVTELAAIELEGGRAQRHSIFVSRRPATLTKQWRIPVREWAEQPEWQDQHGNIVGSHDEHHQVRAEYVAAAERALYIDGELQADLLTSNCIEAQNWSLDINQYRWPHTPDIPEGASTTQLIDELREVEQDILNRLDHLQALLGVEP